MVKPKFYKANGNPELPNSKKPFYGIGKQTYNDEFSSVNRGSSYEEGIALQSVLEIEEQMKQQSIQEERERRRQEQEEETRRMEDERMEQERVHQEEANYPMWHDYNNDNIMDDFW